MGARLAPSPARHRTRIWVALGAAVAVFLALRGFVAWSDWRDTGTAPPKAGASSTTYPARTVDAGPVAVKLQPLRLDASGAAFKVSFDTHSVELNVDVARQARLVVGTTVWPAAGWTGDGPGGHHREGQLTFTAAGAPDGPATLTLGGLPKPVSATWTVGS